MERKQFLRSLGAGAAFALTFPCLHGCSNDESETTGNIVEEPSGVNFTIDLTSPEAEKLAENGGFILQSLVVVARNLEGEFVAASQVCSHEAYDQVRFVENDGGIFYCDVHGSRFAQNGDPMNQVDSKPAKQLKVYTTELTGNMLRIFES